jgi:hypothetical protein
MAREFTPEEMQRREAALERLRSMRVKLPSHYKFDRDEANSRDGLRRWLDKNGKPVKDTESEGDSFG